MTLKDFIRVFSNETRFLIIDGNPEDENYSVLFNNILSKDLVDNDIFEEEFFKEYNNITMVEIEFDIQYDTSYVCIYVTKD